MHGIMGTLMSEGTAHVRSRIVWMSVVVIVVLGPTPIHAAEPPHAAIGQWEWVNPAEPGQGKRPSSTLCPVRARVALESGTNLLDGDLARVCLAGANLAGAHVRANVTGATFAGADLSGARCGSVLDGVDLTNAEIVGAEFNRWTRLTAGQLYSTASYGRHDLAGVCFDVLDLRGWDFAGQNLRGATFKATLSGSSFRGAELTSAQFDTCTLTNADFTDALVAEARFCYVTAHSFTAAQLSSTASYKARDLHGICLHNNDLTGWDFVGQNLTGAALWSKLAGTDFTDALVSGADFTSATGSGFTAAQLHSTASYKTRDLHGIRLRNNDLTGWKLTHQNLMDVLFCTVVWDPAVVGDHDTTGAMLSGAGLWAHASIGFTAADFFRAVGRNAWAQRRVGLGKRTEAACLLAQQRPASAYQFEANLTGTDLTGADLRGAFVSREQLARAVTRNTIRSDGTIAGLDLNGGELLIVRDDDGDPGPHNPRPPFPIRVGHGTNMGVDGVLRLVFEADAWDSMVLFDPGIPVTLGGTLELTFAPGVDVARQVGRTFKVFDWTGVSPTGEFTIRSGHTWDTSRLHTTGEVRLLTSRADFDGDLDVDGKVLGQRPVSGRPQDDQEPWDGNARRRIVDAGGRPGRRTSNTACQAINARPWQQSDHEAGPDPGGDIPDGKPRHREGSQQE